MGAGPTGLTMAIELAVVVWWSGSSSRWPNRRRQPLIDPHVSDEWLQVGFAERRNLVVLADELRAGPDSMCSPTVPCGAEPPGTAAEAGTLVKSDS
ncbi:MAG: hypothetical protein ACRDTG_00045 [Pseudonocardiaceae bacterium]